MKVGVFMLDELLSLSLSLFLSLSLSICRAGYELDIHFRILKFIGELCCRLDLARLRSETLKLDEFFK